MLGGAAAASARSFSTASLHCACPARAISCRSGLFNICLPRPSLAGQLLWLPSCFALPCFFAQAGVAFGLPAGAGLLRTGAGAGLGGAWRAARHSTSPARLPALALRVAREPCPASKKSVGVRFLQIFLRVRSASPGAIASLAAGRLEAEAAESNPLAGVDDAAESRCTPLAPSTFSVAELAVLDAGGVVAAVLARGAGRLSQLCGKRPGSFQSGSSANPGSGGKSMSCRSLCSAPPPSCNGASSASPAPPTRVSSSRKGSHRSPILEGSKATLPCLGPTRRKLGQRLSLLASPFDGDAPRQEPSQIGANAPLD